MAKRNAAVTKARILHIAEKLFSESGFDGTRVDDIAKEAKVNKALIYYYFKSKDDILDALFTSTMQEIIQLIEECYEDFQLDDDEIENIFNLFINTLFKRKRILKVVLMESLKSKKATPFIFKIADYFINSEVDTIINVLAKKKLVDKEKIDKKQMMVTEFFTGMMPMINYVVFEEDWRKQYNMDEKELRERFLLAFKMTHVAYHLAVLKA